MALGDENGGGMVMPVSPIGNGGGFGGDGFGSGWWIILLFILLGGWGNGFGGGGFGGDGLYPWMNQNNNINSGFRDQMLNSGINNLQNSITSGFGDLQTALCGGFAGVNASIANGFAQTEIAANARQMADMNRSFDAQVSTLQGFNGLQGQLAQCCCDNRLATCQSQNIVQNEGAATRLAIQNGVQAVLDKICADKIDAKNEKIVELNNRINSLEANNYIQNALTAQTQYFLSRYPVPTETAPATA